MFLKYSSVPDQVVISGNSDIGLLSALKNSIIQLKTDFFSRVGSIAIKSEEKTEFEKRFILFEHELDGLLRRRIEYSGKDFVGGTRNLDFTTLLN